MKSQTPGQEIRSCLIRMRTLYPQLTRKEQQIADYIMANNDVIYQTITEMVERSGLGYGSIIRFCQRLGYKGFQDFKIYLSQDIVQQKTNGEPRNYFTTMAERAKADIDHTLELLSEHEVNGAARAIAKAGHIVVAGCGGSAVTAMELEYRLLRFGLSAVSTSDNHLQCIRVSPFQKDDVAFLVSFSGSTKELIRVGEIARERSATVICLTNHVQSPITLLSTFKLVTAVKVDPLGAEVVSMVANDFVLDVLCHRILQLREQTNQALVDTYQAVSDRQL